MSAAEQMALFAEAAEAEAPQADAQPSGARSYADFAPEERGSTSRMKAAARSAPADAEAADVDPSLLAFEQSLASAGLGGAGLGGAGLGGADLEDEEFEDDELESDDLESDDLADGEHEPEFDLSEVDADAPMSGSGQAGSVAREHSITREQRRSRRKRTVRARTISVKRMTRREIEQVKSAAVRETIAPRPLTRSECAEGPRPCPFISCKYHLYLDVSPKTGSIKINFPDVDPWDLPVSCALDVADAGGSTLEDVGTIMNLTRERIRQLEVKALSKLEGLDDVAELRDDEMPASKTRLPLAR
jgi:hypothetical protein